MRGVIFDARQRLRLNYSENRKMLGPLPWLPRDDAENANERVSLSGIGSPLPTVSQATISRPVGTIYMGSFDRFNYAAQLDSGGLTTLLPERIIEGNISLYLHPSRAATVTIGVRGYLDETVLWSQVVNIPAGVWTRVSASGLNELDGFVQPFADVIPQVGAALPTDFVYATASQVTAGDVLYDFIDHDITDEWLDVERLSLDPVVVPSDQLGLVEPSGGIGSAVRHEVAPWDDNTISYTNFIPDPRATDAAQWLRSGDAGVTETAISGAVDGPLLPDGTMATTYMRYTITSVGTGNALFGTANHSMPSDVPAGESIAIAIYVRSSVAAASISVRKDGYLDGVATGSAQGSPSSPIAANVWERRSGIIVNNATLDEVYVQAQFPVGSRVVGQVIEVVCAMMVRMTAVVPNHFDGATRDTVGVLNEWTGAVNGSPSRQRIASAATVPLQMTNLVTDPRATSAARWVGVFGTDGTGTETMVTGAVDGPELPDGTTATTYVRYTWTTANTASPVAASFNYDSAAYPAVRGGDIVSVAIYARTSEPTGLARASFHWNDGTISTEVLGPAENVVGNSWRVWKIDASALPATALELRTVRFRFSRLMPIGSTIDATCALTVVGPAAAPDHFDGASTDDEWSSEWLGAANASQSMTTRVADIYPWSVR